MDLDNCTHPICYSDIATLYSDISPHQLSSLVEEGVNHMVSSGGKSREHINILQPVQDVRLSLSVNE